MTARLEEAIAAVRKLPPEEQDGIAEIILSELEDERRWDESFAKSQDKLKAMAEQVREDIRAGRVHRMGIDEL